MKSLICGLVFALLGTPAFANGIVEPVAVAPVIVTPPTQDWSGGYVGGSIGSGEIRSTFCALGSPTASCLNGVTLPNFPSPEASGVLFGITGGYDWQVGNVVYGIVGDLMFGDFGDAVPSSGGFLCGGAGLCSMSVDGVAMLRGRVGYAVSDRLLPYATLGVAVTQVEVGLTLIPPYVTDTATNAVIGAGFEYRTTDTISIGFNFLHLVERPQHIASGIAGGSNQGVTDFSGDIARLSVLYRF